MLRLVTLVALLALVAVPSFARPSSSGPARLHSPAPAPRALSGDETVEERSLDEQHHALQHQQRENEPLASSAVEVEGDEGSKDTATGTKRKRCLYIGTFFHAIDCNAPANSTSIPYAPAAPLISATTGAAEEEGVPVVTTGLVTARRGKSTGKAESG
ncbi:hypothetical protein JCM10450v2_004602 [Rhodotorula kratochvilovae]